MSGLGPMFRKLGHLQGVAEHLIVIGLVTWGSFLAASKAPEETTLQATLHAQHVAGTSSAHLQLTNPTKHAIKVNVLALRPKPVRVRIDAPEGEKTAGRSPTWEGHLAPGKQLDVLVVLDGDLPEALVDKLFDARLTVVEAATGAIKQQPVEIRAASALSISRTVRYGAWFMAPLLAAGVLYLLFGYVRARVVAARPPHAAV